MVSYVAVHKMIAEQLSLKDNEKSNIGVGVTYTIFGLDYINGQFYNRSIQIKQYKKKGPIKNSYKTYEAVNNELTES